MPFTDSETAPTSISLVGFQRLETKIDRMSLALEKLVLVEERQGTQAVSLLEVRRIIETNKDTIDRVDKKVDQWINRGIGIWAFASIVFVILELALNTFGKH